VLLPAVTDFLACCADNNKTELIHSKHVKVNLASKSFHFHHLPNGQNKKKICDGPTSAVHDADVLSKGVDIAVDQVVV
jgi:hypothetical protein